MYNLLSAFEKKTYCFGISMILWLFPSIPVPSQGKFFWTFVFLFFLTRCCTQIPLEICPRLHLKPFFFAMNSFLMEWSLVPKHIKCSWEVTHEQGLKCAQSDAEPAGDLQCIAWQNMCFNTALKDNVSETVTTEVRGITFLGPSQVLS